MMPLADMFAPDVNFTTARSVYPTAGGGTTASAAGAMTANTNTVIPDPATGAAMPTTAVGVSPSGHTVWWWVGALVLLVAMVVIARKAGGEEDFRNIRPTAYNFLTITLTAIVGIVALKTLAARYRVPGASDIILAV